MPKFPSSSVSWRWRTRMLQIHHIEAATHLVRIGLLCFDFNALLTHYNQLPSRFRPSKSEHTQHTDLSIQHLLCSVVAATSYEKYAFFCTLLRRDPASAFVPRLPSYFLSTLSIFCFHPRDTIAIFSPNILHFFCSYRSAFVCTCCPNNIFLSPALYLFFLEE